MKNRKFIRVGERFFVVNDGFVMLYRWEPESGAEIIPHDNYTPAEKSQHDQLQRDKP